MKMENIALDNFRPVPHFHYPKKRGKKLDSCTQGTGHSEQLRTVRYNETNKSSGYKIKLLWDKTIDSDF